MNIPTSRSLLLLDGHTSRLQYELWQSLSEQNVDVLILPSHSSQDLQPLDKSVNGEFKLYLQHVRGMPRTRQMNAILKDFIVGIIESMFKSLSPPSIRAGFYKAHLMNNKYDIIELKKEIDECLEKEVPESCHLGVFLYFFPKKYILLILFYKINVIYLIKN
jgi:hypothetical protein